MPQLSGSRARQLSTSYALSTLVFGIVSVMAWGVARLAYLSPASPMLSPDLFGDLSALYAALMPSCVALPLLLGAVAFRVLPSAAGLDDLRRPGLALLSWLLHVAGGGLLVYASMDGGLEPAWPAFVSAPSELAGMSRAFLPGLLLIEISTLLSSVVILSTVRARQRPTISLFAVTAMVGSGLLVLASTMSVIAVALGIVVQVAGVTWFESATSGWTTVVPLVTRLSTGPQHTALLLLMLGVVALVFRAERALSGPTTRLWVRGVVAVATLGLFAVDASGWFVDLHPAATIAGTACRALASAVSLALLAGLVRARMRIGAPPRAEDALTALALLLVVAFLPLDLFLNSAAASYWATSYVGDAVRVAVYTWAPLLCGWAALHATAGRREATTARTFVCVTLLAGGMMATLAPMLIMGTHGVHMAWASYPQTFLPLQVLMTGGGWLLAAGAAVTALDLALAMVPIRR